VQELEALLTQYLSHNWHRIDTVMAANALDLRRDGLVCLTPSSLDTLPSAASRLSLASASRDSPRADGSTSGRRKQGSPRAQATPYSGRASASAAPAVLASPPRGGSGGSMHSLGGASSEPGSARSLAISNGLGGAHGTSGRASMSAVSLTGSEPMSQSSRSASMAGSLSAMGGSSRAWRRARRNWQRAYQVRHTRVLWHVCAAERCEVLLDSAALRCFTRWCSMR
jgi:hypothetical protein